jgi:uncharacterized damage-inducible protein DinB
MSEESFIESTPAPENLENPAENLENEIIETPAERKRINSLKLKFNGKEIEEKLPFEIEDDPKYIEYLTKQAQMAKLAASKAQEYSNLEKEASGLKQDIAAFFQELKTNPKKALQNPLVGVDIKMLAAEILEEALEEEAKSPEQREKEKLQARLAELEEERKREKEEAEKSRYAAALESAYARYDSALEAALTKNPDLPQTPYIVEKMAKYMTFMVEEGYEPDMNIITEQVRTEMEADVKHLLTMLPPEKVEQIMGAEVLGKLRKSRLAKAKAAPVPVKSAIKDTAPAKPQINKKEAPKQTIRDFLKV